MYDYEIHDDGRIELTNNGMQTLLASYDLDQNLYVVDHVSYQSAHMLKAAAK